VRRGYVRGRRHKPARLASAEATDERPTRARPTSCRDAFQMTKLCVRTYTSVRPNVRGVCVLLEGGWVYMLRYGTMTT